MSVYRTIGPLVYKFHLLLYIVHSVYVTLICTLLMKYWIFQHSSECERVLFLPGSSKGHRSKNYLNS